MDEKRRRHPIIALTTGQRSPGTFGRALGSHPPHCVQSNRSTLYRLSRHRPCDVGSALSYRVRHLSAAQEIMTPAAV
ncbi:unnamed protein product, partial [Iphiclides podalirius]